MEILKSRCKRRHLEYRHIMADFLNRQSSPLSDEQWKTFENVIISVAREQLVGRRFIPIVGPLGAGVQHINIDTFIGRS